MRRSKSPKLRRKTTKVMAIMKVKNRALAVWQKANKKFVVATTKQEKEVEIRYRDSTQNCASFIFNHGSKRYFLYCKGKRDQPTLDLKTEDTPEDSEETNLFKVTMDSERYKFQPYLNDGWFLSVSKSELKLVNNDKSENTLFVLEKCEQSPPPAGEMVRPLEGNLTTSTTSSSSSSSFQVSQQQHK